MFYIVKLILSIGITMKKIPRVLSGETIKHKGDLTIEGNVEKGAVIELDGGSLIVEGNIESGSKITVTATQELKSEPGVSDGFVLGGVYSFTQKAGVSVKFNLKDSQIKGKLPIVSFVNATSSISMNGTKIYKGEVNINDRILTKNALVKECGKGIYEITSDSRDLFSLLMKDPSNESPAKPVSATIDDIVYQGNLIRVEGKSVFVDGKLQTGVTVSASSASAAVDMPLHPPVFLVKGTIQNEVVITRSDITMQAGDIGEGCIIRNIKNLTAGNLGSGTVVKAEEAIKIKNTGTNVELRSARQGIEVENLGYTNSIVADGAITAGNIGNRCVVISRSKGIRAKDVGNETTITAQDLVSLNNVGFKSAVTSEKDCVQANDIASEVQINAIGDITLRHVENACRITSHQNSVSLQNIGTHVTVTARQQISVQGTCPDPSTLSFTSNKMIHWPRQAAVAQASSVSPISMFRQAAKPTVKIPSGFICPISSQIMEDPVLLVVDGNTYERNEITRRLMLADGSTASAVNQVLIPNRALAKCIAEFLEQHPDLATEVNQHKTM